MRRNEVLGLKWTDIDFTRRRLGIDRGLVAIGYEVHVTTGKIRTSRRTIDLDTTTLAVLAGWKQFQAADCAAVGINPNEQWVFTDGNGATLRPHTIQDSFRRAVTTPTRPRSDSTIVPICALCRPWLVGAGRQGQVAGWRRHYH